MSPPAYRTLPARSEPVSAAGGASPCDLRLRTARPDAAPDSAALRIACSAEGFARARAFTRDTLSGWALDHRCDDAVLVMTELASNALAHGSPAAPPGTGEIGLGLALHSGFFTLSVSDTGDDAPVYARPDGPDLREHGRGLCIVDALADEWGWSPRPPAGKTVWATLSTSPLI